MQWDAARLLALCGLQTPPALFGSPCVQSQPLPTAVLPRSHAPLRVPDCPPPPRALVSARHHPDNPGSLPAATPWTRTHLRSPFDSRGGTFAGSGIGHAHLRCCHYSVVIRLNVFLVKGPKSKSDTERSSAQPGLAPGPPPPAAAGTRQPRLCVYRLRLFLAVGSCVLFLRLARKRGGSHGICLSLSRT